ncbi:MAG: DUF3105 domain-containing protein [Pseudomonadota bacterium]
MAAVAGIAWYWIQTTSAERDFMALAEEGRDNLDAVQSHPNRGRSHFSPGGSYNYGEPFPTSGPHDPIWLDPGFYHAAMPATRIVHSLEHGNVVIYYDRPGDDVMEMIEDWVGLYPGQWDGLIATPSPGLGSAVMLNAWTKSLELDPFDPIAAAAFIDTYRGRGPENPVR